MAKLIFIDRDFAGRTCDLVVEKTTVGRNDQNTLVIRHETVSSQHCEIIANDPEVIVRDLGSRNGTYIDGVRFTGQRQVKSGQSIRFGQVEARLELTCKSPEDSSTDETAIRLHQHALRDAAAAKIAPASGPQPALNPADNRPMSEGPTILFPTAMRQPTTPGLTASNVDTAPLQGEQPKRWLLIIIGVIAVVVVGGVLWWVLVRK